MTTLVECWNKLDGNVGELSSWVSTKVFICRKSSLMLGWACSDLFQTVHQQLVRIVGS